MIYVEEKDFDRQIQLLSFLASNAELFICAWLYPESSSSTLAGFEVTDNPESLIPVTTYEDEFQPKCTLLVPANGTNIEAFSEAYPELKINCDSLALYKKSDLSWLAATIGHEGMCLVQNDEILNSLIQVGYPASIEAPTWW